MRHKLKILRYGRSGHLYMVSPDLPTANILPDDNNTNPIVPPVIPPVKNDTDVPFTNPRFEQDFYSMECPALAQLIIDLQNQMQTGRYTAAAYAYYTNKIVQMQTAYSARCGKPPAGSGDGVTVVPNPGTPGVTVNVGDTTGINPVPGFGAGSGGGAGDSTKDKKSNWWLWALCIGTFCLALYKGRNTTIKLPG